MGRMLGKESFGELNMVQSNVGLFGAAAGMGMGMAAAKYRDTDATRAGRFIGLARANPLIQIFTQVLIAQRFRNDSK